MANKGERGRDCPEWFTPGPGSGGKQKIIRPEFPGDRMGNPDGNGEFDPNFPYSYQHILDSLGSRETRKIKEVFFPRGPLGKNTSFIFLVSLVPVG